jgi:hypothetical protein
LPVRGRYGPGQYQATKRGNEIMNRGILIVGVTFLMVACTPQSKEAKQELAQPVNCPTAEGDIRVLEGEKAHVAKQVASGVTAIAPAGLALGIVTGTEGDKLQVASGDYNDQIDKKIAEIKSTCGL